MNRLTWSVALKHLDLLLVVRPAEKLSLLDNVLVTLLKSDSADDTEEAAKVEHVVSCRSHHQLR